MLNFTFFKTSLLTLFICSCNPHSPTTMEKHHNHLIDESSPYLLQHAHNPVNWYPWGEEALQKAADEDKLLIISIGYSSCHWCHVMEREVFEDSTAAALMNQHYISVKVDREERPDVDQVYMTALQLMTGQGGWPLNIVALPDGRPVWGATYVPNDKWQAVLSQLAGLYQNDREKMLEYAEKLTEGVRQAELVQHNPTASEFTTDMADELVKNWQAGFDTVEGGPNRAPKFPMPDNYHFLLDYAHLTESSEVEEQVKLTLDKMAAGGIYDQIGGGFARYSVDGEWRVPHFEKMLYDNAQLIALYSLAYQKFRDENYQRVVQQSIAWLEREMSGADGEFYSALDADSEGEEGKFYVWSKEELKQAIGAEDWPDFSRYYDLEKGLWEGHIILMRSGEGVDSAQLQRWQDKLMHLRDQRVRPGLDDKSLTSWNAMMISGLVDAQLAFPHKNYLKRAEETARWLLNHQARKDASLWHSYKAGKSSIEGLIEDYAFAIEAFLKLYEATGNIPYLEQAEEWMNYALANFEDSATGLFYTRSLHSEQLIARSMETSDNVIPAANSVMAHNLFRLGHHLDKSSWREQAEHMLKQIDRERLLEYGENYSNWARLMLKLTHPHYEVAIVGKEAEKRFYQFQQQYLPNVIWALSNKKSDLPLLENRFVQDQTLIYVCQEGSCQLPVSNSKAALEQIRQ